MKLPTIAVGTALNRVGQECAEVRVPGAGADSMAKAMQVVSGAVVALARRDVAVSEPEFQYGSATNGDRWVAGRIAAFSSESAQADTRAAVAALVRSAEHEAQARTLRHPVGITLYRVVVVAR